VKLKMHLAGYLKQRLADRAPTPDVEDFAKRIAFRHEVLEFRHLELSIAHAALTSALATAALPPAVPTRSTRSSLKRGFNDKHKRAVCKTASPTPSLCATSHGSTSARNTPPLASVPEGSLEEESA
jgi:hypothetical protein